MTPEKYLKIKRTAEECIFNLNVLLEQSKAEVVVPLESELRSSIESDFIVGQIIYTRLDNEWLWHIIDRIDRDEYVASTGYRYSKTNLTIQKWVRK